MSNDFLGDNFDDIDTLFETKRKQANIRNLFPSYLTDYINQVVKDDYRESGKDDCYFIDLDPRIKGLTHDKVHLLRHSIFYCGNYNGNADHTCCFNHITGLPTKKGVPQPIFDYEMNLLNTFEQYKLIWILKARGLGITEFSLRFMTWKAITGNSRQFLNSQMAVIVGPKLDIAKDIIGRIRVLFANRLGLIFETKSEEVIMPYNNVLIRAYPSNHIDAFRGQPNVSLILVDEGDFFLKGQQKAVRDTIEPYNTKSEAQIAFVSTPNLPGGLMQSIEKETELTSDYVKLRLDYTVGLGKIYTLEEIEAAKKRGYFQREYNLKYEGIIGNAFHQQDIEDAITTVYNPYDAHSTSTYYGRSIGIDEGFGSSQFAIVITQGRDNMVEVIYAETFDRPLHNDMIETIVRLKNKHHVSKVYIDASNAGFLMSLKQRVGDQDYQNYVEQERTVKHITDPLVRYNSAQITPVNFSTSHKEMLHHTDQLLNNHKIRIHPDFTKLITSLRTAQVSETWVLDKELTAFDDVLDAFRLSLLNYHLGPRD